MYASEEDQLLLLEQQLASEPQDGAEVPPCMADDAHAGPGIGAPLRGRPPPPRQPAPAKQPAQVWMAGLQRWRLPIPGESSAQTRVCIAGRGPLLQSPLAPLRCCSPAEGAYHPRNGQLLGPYRQAQEILLPRACLGTAASAPCCSPPCARLQAAPRMQPPPWGHHAMQASHAATPTTQNPCLPARCPPPPPRPLLPL